ncbi:MAG: DUF1697 domain-containing protein [Planctomycetaceae bacterium]
MEKPVANQIALLRAINVAGRNLVAMSNLRGLLADLGFAGAVSRLQSGNLVFRSARQTGAALERRLEAETAKRLGVSVDYLVRTADQWLSIVADNPFPDQAARDPGRLVVIFLKSAPPADNLRRLQSAIVGPEIVRAAGKQLYAVYPNGIGRSKLTNTLIERSLGTRGTARNWNTVLKIAALVQR